MLQTLFLDNHNRHRRRTAEGESHLDRRAALRGGPQAQYRRVPVDHLQRVDSRPCWAPMRCRPTRATTRTSMPASPTNSRRSRSASATACSAATSSGRATTARPVAADVPLAEDFFDPDDPQRRGPAVDDRSGHRTDDHRHRRRAEGRRRRRRPGRGRAGHQRSPQRALQRGRARRRLRPGPDRSRHRRGAGINGIGSYNEVRECAGTAGRDQLLADHEQRARCRRSCRRLTATSTTSTPSREDWPRIRSPAPTSVRCSRRSWSNQFTRLRDGDRFFYLNETVHARSEQAHLATRATR